MLTLTPIKFPPLSRAADIGDLVCGKLRGSVKDGDVLVVSSKFVAVAEGRVVSLRSVKPSAKAKELASAYHLDRRLCELVIRESDEVIGGVPGFLLTLKEGLLTPNAGIDKSNVRHGWVVLYPRRPEVSARRIRESVQFELGAIVGVVVCDSRLSPTRRGTTGVAVASSGIEGIVDMRGRPDLFGNVLKVTSQAVADDLSSAAELLMGESDEGTPMVLVRGVSRALVRDADYPSKKFSISAEECVYLRSLGYQSGAKPEYAFKHARPAGRR